MNTYKTSPRSLVASLYRNRQLLLDLALRETTSRHKGSALGIFWTLLTPLFLLCIYTFIFSEIFKSRWPDLNDASKASFAIILFSGLIAFNFFSECLSRAPSVIVANQNFVKKIIFPLEILPCVTLLSALIQFLISLAILFVFQIILMGRIPLTALLAPLAFLPLFMLTLGLSWFLAAAGVYIRDIGHTIGLILTALLFLSPIFFPLSSFPEEWRHFASLNPLALPIEQLRNVIVFSKGLDMSYMLYYTAFALIIMWLGYWSFQASRRGFADVI